MARSTTPRSGTRRGTTTTGTAGAKPKRAVKPKAPAETTETTESAVATPPAPAKRATAKPSTRARVTKATSGPPNTRTASAKTSAKRKTAAKPKPRASAKTNSSTSRTAKAKAAVVSTAGAVAKKLPDIKLPEVKLPDLPEVTAKRMGIGAGVLAGLGAALFLWRSSRADQPDYKVVEQEGDFEIREYPATTTAATTSRGPRRDAMERNFRTLADYIFAKSRPGEKLEMTTPVTTAGSAIDGWTMRFFMPSGKARGDLPAAPEGVTLESHPPRRAGVVRFSGSWTDALLDTKEGALRSWLQQKGYPHEAKAEHAAYNSPMMPGPLRRNELLVTLSEG